MVDLSKHHEKIKHAIDRRNYDLAIALALECQEIEPYNLETYRLLVDGAKRRQREGGKNKLSLGLSLSSDPHKKLSVAIKKMAGNPSMKTFKAAGDAAHAIFEAERNRAASDVAVFLYEEAKATGLFSDKLLWNMAQHYYNRYKAYKDYEALDHAVDRMRELVAAAPKHPDAGRTLSAWQANQSMESRNRRKSERGHGDFRDDIAADDQSRRQELYSRTIRTREDAQQVLELVDADIKESPKDKALWQKRADVLMKVSEWGAAREALEQAQKIDPHDFVITMRRGDCDIFEARQRLMEARKSGEGVAEAEQRLLDIEIVEYGKRSERQPTEMQHRYLLGRCLLHNKEVDKAAAQFQRAVIDPKHKRQCHKYLGHCFAAKNLLDLAVQQYTSCLALIEDEMSDEFKEVTYNRGRLLEQAGKTTEAVADYTRLVQLDLGYKDAATRLGSLQSNAAG